MLRVWNLLGGPHESGYINILPKSSPLAQCSTDAIHPALLRPTLRRGLVEGVMTREPAFLFSVGPSGD